MIIKQRIYCYILLFLFIVSSIPIPMMDNTLVVSARDEITWENQYGKLLVYPKISTNLIRQKQYYEITWYYPDNNLDVAFCFTNPISYGAIYYWNGTAYNKLKNINYVQYLGKHYYVLEDIYFKKNKKMTGYWEYNVPPNSEGKWDMYLKLHSDTFQQAIANNRYIHLDPWWDSNWKFKKKITFDEEQVLNTLVNFPVCINLSSDPELATNVGFTDGRDIAFVDSSETTQLYHEIEYFNSGTGYLLAWVNVTLLRGAVDTDIYMYYGNTGCANQSSPANVWDSHYSAVYHMNGNTWGDIDDSTANNLDATGHNSAPIYAQTSILGKGVQFDGTDDYISLVDAAGFDLGDASKDWAYTIEAVIQKTDSGVNPILTKYDSGIASREWIFRVLTTDLTEMWQYDETKNKYCKVPSSKTIENNKYHYLVGTYTGGNPTNPDNIHTYINGTNYTGVDDKEAGYEDMVDGLAVVEIGHYAAQYYKGIIDEIRVSKKIGRNSSWIDATNNTIMNATDGGFFTLGDEETMNNIEPPTGFLATTELDGDIYLNWTMGLNSTHTRVEYNTISNWARGTGILLYNDSTDVEYTHNGLSCDIRYYYLAWGYNSTQNNWSISSNISNISCPGNPTSIETRLYTGALNFTWVNNTYSNTTVLVRKANSYPSSPSDGAVVCNTTNTTWNDTGFVLGTSYYTIYSYNETVNRYSSGVEIAASTLTINVYDENTSIAIADWSVHISNSDGSDVYEQLGCSNPTTINTNDLPLGLISILINASGYESRIYYMTISVNNIYSLDAFLPEVNTSTNYYVIQINDQLNEPISDVLVTVNEYDSTSDVFTEVSSQYTDAYGQIGLYLIGGKHYKVNYSKTGYTNVSGADYFPDPNYYGIYYPKLFIMYFGTGDDETIYTPEDVIDFKAYINDSGRIIVHYYDNRGNTINTEIRIYQYYNYTLTLNNTDNRASSSFNWITTGYNISMMHRVTIWINHSDFNSMLCWSILIDPVRRGIVTEKTIEDRFTEVFGDWDMGYARTLLVFLPCLFFLVVFGGHHTGLGIISAGLYLGFSSYMVDIEGAVSFITLGGFLAVAGFIVIITKHGGRRV